MDNANEERGGADKILKAIDNINDENLAEYPLIAGENIAEVFAIADAQREQMIFAMRTIVKEIYNQ